MQDIPSAHRGATPTHSSRRSGRQAAWFVHRPDRVALWAFLMAVFAAIVAAASGAQASSGGVSTWSAESASLDGKRWTRSIATWYGPGFFGNQTACGQELKRGTVGVAHKRLPCGTKVVFAYRGRILQTKVIDRGPYTNDARWDLTQAAARALRFEATDKVRASVIKRSRR